MKGPVQAFHIQIHLEGLVLPSKGVAAHHHIQPSQKRLVSLDDGGRHQDHARTGGQGGKTLGQGGAQRLQQPEPIGEAADSGRLAPRYHQPVQPPQILGSAHQSGRDAQTPKSQAMFPHIALKRQHPYDGRHGHQPRVAKRSVASRVPISMPAIGSPRPRDASATTPGLSQKVVASTMAAA